MLQNREGRGMTDIDLDQAILDPSSVFQTPEEVLQRDDLTTEQKIKILKHWEYDAREIMVAEEENMPGGERTATLYDEILKALHTLHATFDVEHTPPTKQGGE